MNLGPNKLISLCNHGTAASVIQQTKKQAVLGSAIFYKVNVERDPCFYTDFVAVRVRHAMSKLEHKKHLHTSSTYVI